VARQGLTRRAPDPAGGRSGVIELTERGRAALAAERASRAERVATLLHDWDEQERNTLARLIGRLNDGIDARITALAEQPSA
jgi:DNA-binding MarR family transcriptional regulator